VRPVNLIPPEERHGERAPLRRGPLAYVLVGGLALAFVVVLVTVLLNNRVVERESELAAARAELERATAEAEALAPYAQFVAAQQQREATVVSLADSRFDWERVLRELALVITDDVWLLKLTGSASGGADSPLGGEVAGPSLAIKGCGRDHKAVARFIAALQDIDGVTRVGLADSVRAGIDDEGGGGGSGGDSTCVGKGMPATFNALATFDAVTPSEQAEGGAAPEPPAEPEGEATASAQNGSSGGGAANAVVPGVAP
jgi:Tfp pilus assembly protein PilN